MSNRIAAATSDRLELLETFLRIVEAGGIGAASRLLDTTQPTVTRRLQQLEALFDAKLIERGLQGVSLTPAGAKLLPEAQDVIDRWRGLEASAVEADDSGVSGIVRMIAPSALGHELLPELFARFRAEHPDVRLEMRLRDGAVDLIGDGADFALRFGKTVSDEISTRKVTRIRWGLAASPSLARALGVQLGLALERCEPLALEGAPFVSLAPHQGARQRFFGRNDETEEVRFERMASFDAIEPAVRFALDGVGLTLLPEWRLAPEIEAGRLTRVAADWRPENQRVTLSWITSRFCSAAASALMQQIQEELPALLGES